MAERVHDAFLADLEQLRARLYSLVASRVLTSEQAIRQQFEFIRKNIELATTDDGTTVVPIVCPCCEQVTVVARDVVTFKCPRSPNVERYVSRSRALDINGGIIGAERIMQLAQPSASDGRLARG